MCLRGFGQAEHTLAVLFHTPWLSAIRFHLCYSSYNIMSLGCKVSIFLPQEPTVQPVRSTDLLIQDRLPREDNEAIFTSTIYQAAFLNLNPNCDELE